MTNVLIIEDHPIVAEATRRYLADFHPEIDALVCATADEARTALSDASRGWHCILLDIEIPGAVGLSFAQEIHSMGLHRRCCVLSGRESRDYIGHLHAQGFLGYIKKASATDAFAASLKAIFNGSRRFPSVETLGPQTMLTRRQMEVLEMVGSGLSSKHAASTLAITEAV